MWTNCGYFVYIRSAHYYYFSCLCLCACVLPYMAIFGDAPLLSLWTLFPLFITIVCLQLGRLVRMAHEKVSEATKSTERTQKRYYDSHSKQTTFHEGQLVWLYWPRPPVRQRF